MAEVENFETLQGKPIAIWVKWNFISGKPIAILLN
jgi:hypothetical protein